jgi:hypothetical protein
MNQAILIVSALVLFPTYIWLIVLAYKRSGLLWAVLIAFFSLVAGLIFCISKKEGWLPWALNVIAWFTFMAAYNNWF